MERLNPDPEVVEALYPFDASALTGSAGVPDGYGLVVAFCSVPGDDEDSVGLFVTAVRAHTGVGVGTLTIALTNGACAWISDVYVHPQHRRRGLAGSLVRAACLLAQRHGLETVGLSAKDGSDAVRLYERLGFRYVWKSNEGMSAYLYRLEEASE